MKKIKRIIASTAIITCFASTVIFAKAGGYSSTYDMTGGVFSEWIQPKSKCTINIKPTIGTPGQDIAVIWADRKWYGWDGTLKWTSSTEQGIVTFKSSNKRKVWLRNHTGHRWTGKVSFSWD